MITVVQRPHPRGLLIHSPKFQIRITALDSSAFKNMEFALQIHSEVGFILQSVADTVTVKLSQKTFSVRGLGSRESAYIVRLRVSYSKFKSYVSTDSVDLS